jgi:uncharacterized MAPEG superfamily protein
MELIAIVVALALIEYMVFALLTGRARVKYGVAAPATVGHPIFDRYFRVQMNTLEQLIVFVPAVFLFGRYVSAPIAAALGVVYILGRILYFVGYVADPAKRAPGFLTSYLATVLLVLGGLAGAAVAWF